MARLDLLDEYTCVVTPKHSRNRTSEETARVESSGQPADAAWKPAVAAIVGIAVLVVAVATL
jgi:hypothetical protein